MFEPASVIEAVRSFVTGEMAIGEFVQKFRESDDIAQYLEGIIERIEAEHIPIKRRTVFQKGVARDQPYEQRSYAETYIKEYACSFRDLSPSWKENPPKVGNHLRRLAHQTASGAFEIHATVADVYYQVDPALVRTERYHEEFEFSLDVLPQYLAGGIAAEDYVSSRILPLYPPTMKKGERKKRVKEAIQGAFLRDCKGFPSWIQTPEWPMGSDGKPMVYTGQKKSGQRAEYYFRDAVTGEKYTVTQQW